MHIERKNEREFALALTDFECACAQRSPMRIWAPLALTLRQDKRRSLKLCKELKQAGGIIVIIDVFLYSQDAEDTTNNKNHDD